MKFDRYLNGMVEMETDAVQIKVDILWNKKGSACNIAAVVTQK